ncbi:helix-turn-helix domain-containing protein [Thermogutta terrifontis]|uniref:helix-turn-helix domain-containing protein n=1 Tax=Thermogutta terrifontis TaxID=1331910 RepID=UPI003B83744D
MSAKERARLEVFGRVKAGDITLVKASEILGMSYRQVKRSWARSQALGAAGLVHRLRGRSSDRQAEPADKGQSDWYTDAPWGVRPHPNRLVFPSGGSRWKWFARSTELPAERRGSKAHTGFPSPTRRHYSASRRPLQRIPEHLELAASGCHPGRRRPKVQAPQFLPAL